jgi:hypothetical protein
MFDRRFGRAQVVDAVDHRQKNGDRMRGTQPKDGPQLRVQQGGMREQQPDAPKAHGRIGFAGQREIAERFVTADIENADHRFRRLQVFCRGAVELVLLVFRGEMILDQEDELGAIQSDPISLDVRRRQRVGGLPDVGAEPDFDAIASDRRQADQALQDALVNLQVGVQLIVLAQDFGLRIDEGASGQSIDDHQIARTNFPGRLRHLYERGDAERAGEDGGVRGEATFFDNQATHALAFQASNDGGENFAGDDHASLVNSRNIRQPVFRQVIEEASTDVVQIGGTLAEVGIFEATEQFHQLLDRFFDRSLDIHPIFEAKRTHRIAQLHVAQEEDLRFENLRLVLPQSPPDALLNFQQLTLGSDHRGIETLDLSLHLRLAHLPKRNGGLRSGAIAQQSGSAGKT